MATLDERPLLIAGPTASGKSALALARAQAEGGVVINADAMQVYRELRILTARPTPEEEAVVPHRLYGHVSAREAYSVARWLEDVAGALGAARAAGARAIIVGGTGLYFKVLLEGLSPVPPVPGEIREHWRRRAADAEPGALHQELAVRDPVMAARLAPADTQRIARALEVVTATGISLAAWQARPGVPLIDAAVAERIVVLRPRDELQRRADWRLDLMLREGALDEVRGLMQLGLPADRLALRALGVAPFAAHLEGRIGLDEALAQAKLATRQYIKRQETWLRRFMRDWVVAIGDEQ